MRLEDKSPAADWGIWSLERTQWVCVRTAKCVKPDTLPRQELLLGGPEYTSSATVDKEQNLLGSVKAGKYLFSEGDENMAVRKSIAGRIFTSVFPFVMKKP